VIAGTIVSTSQAISASTGGTVRETLHKFCIHSLID
jgi:hypothetical protein